MLGASPLRRGNIASIFFSSRTIIESKDGDRSQNFEKTHRFTQAPWQRINQARQTCGI